MEAGRPTYLLARWLFLRGLALVFAIAFVSLWFQIDGLVGSRGMLPIAAYLREVRSYLGGTAIRELPTLCWWSASDVSLHLQAGAGVALSAALFAGLASRLCLVLLWALYLSLTVAGQDFLSFQWDVLLLETALFAIPFAPATWRPGLARERPPSKASLFLVRWLLFRLVFASGAVKLTSGDPTWTFGDLSALTWHYWTQPLPTVPGWWAQSWPAWFQRLSCALMYAVELGLPFLAFGPRIARRIACVGLVAFQVLIALTGNYGFFNLLSIVLCVPLLDDGVLARWLPRRLGETARVPREPRTYSRAARVSGIAAASVITVLTGLKLVDAVGVPPLPRSIAGPLFDVERAIAPFRSLNDYGLFRVMTKQRVEIEIQGSDDGVDWKPYVFRWKPGPLDRAPPWVQPHMPRLDWQMWFAPLGPARASRWFVPLLDRLLEGSPPVLGLLAENPFPDRPPRIVRAIAHEYRFATPSERARDGNWWARAPAGAFGPSRSRP